MRIRAGVERAPAEAPPAGTMNDEMFGSTVTSASMRA
jgi:hypothetical protein